MLLCGSSRPVPEHECSAAGNVCARGRAASLMGARPQRVELVMVHAALNGGRTSEELLRHYMCTGEGYVTQGPALGCLCGGRPPVCEIMPQWN